jgi:MFS family permease
MSLERSYGTLLRAYPRVWRELHGAEALGLLLDGAEAAGRRRPQLIEVVDLVGHGLASRLGGPVVRAQLETTATLALAAATTLAVVAFGFGEWWPWRTEYRAPQTVGSFATLGGPLLLAVVAAATATLLGYRFGRVLLALCAVAALAITPIAARTDLDRPSRPFLLALGLLLALACAAPVRRTTALVLAGGSVLGMGSLTLLRVQGLTWDPRQAFYFERLGFPALCVGALLTSALLGALLIGRHRLALALNALPWLLLVAASPRRNHGLMNYTFAESLQATLGAVAALLIAAAVGPVGTALARLRAGVPR